MAYQNRRDILAEITLLSTEEGGRSTPAFTGYRPQVRYDDANYSAVQEYIDTDTVLPGQTAKVFLSFLMPEIHAGKLYPEQEFLVCEGSRVIGKGKIIEILNTAITPKHGGETS